MRPFDFTKKNVDEELRILNDPLYQGERPKIVELVGMLQRAQEPADYFELQRRLIVQARARQQIRREIRDARSEVGERMRELAALEPKPVAELAELQRRLDLLAHQERVSEALRYTLLSIGDGIAWRTLGYDRGAICVLGTGERVARFDEGKGFEAEAMAIARLWEEERVFAIHNDLTTCLRHGDLTVPRSLDQRVDLIEVKVSEVLTDEAPQMKRMANAVELLNSGRVTGPDGKLLRLHRIPLRYRTALTDLRPLIVKARDEGHASMRVGGCQFAAAIDYVTSAGQEDRLNRKHAAAREKIGWFDGSHKTFEWLSSGRRMRDRSYSFSMMAPFTIFPLPAEDVADLCLGFIEIYSVLNASLLEGAFARAGIKASVFTPPESNGRFLEAEFRQGNRILVVQVSPQLREQLLLELMTPANVIGAVQGLARELDRDAPGEQEGHIVALSDERRVWKPS